MQQLIDTCEGRQPVTEAPQIGIYGCNQYLSGLVDAWSGLLNKIRRVTFCLPREGVNVNQMRDIVLDWAAEHPQWLDQPAHPQIFNALRLAFPCRQPAPQGDQPQTKPPEPGAQPRPKPNPS